MNTPDRFKLSTQEFLELKNIQLQKRLNQSEVNKTELEERWWSERINTKLGINILEYTIDIASGDCVKFGARQPVGDIQQTVDPKLNKDLVSDTPPDQLIVEKHPKKMANTSKDGKKE